MKFVPINKYDSYKVSLDNVKELIANELDVKVSQVSVEYNITCEHDDLPGFPTYTVKGLIVTVERME